MIIFHLLVVSVGWQWAGAALQGLGWGRIYSCSYWDCLGWIIQAGLAYMPGASDGMAGPLSSQAFHSSLHTMWIHIKNKSCEAFLGWAQYILLVKASHRVSPDLRGGK